MMISVTDQMVIFTLCNQRDITKRLSIVKCNYVCHNIRLYCMRSICNAQASLSTSLNTVVKGT